MWDEAKERSILSSYYEGKPVETGVLDDGWSYEIVQSIVPENAPHIFGATLYTGRTPSQDGPSVSQGLVMLLAWPTLEEARAAVFGYFAGLKVSPGYPNMIDILYGRSKQP